MRVIKITQGFEKNINFEGRKNNKSKGKKQDYASSSRSIYNPSSNGSFLDFSSLLVKPKSAKSAHPYSESYFDIDMLLSITQGKVQPKKAVPFKDSDAKLSMDRYQKEAVDAFNSGKTTIVSAPTGTGKTLIAEHVINKALEDGQKIIYLSPLKALSNEKYGDFAKLFGKYDEDGNLIDTNNVGLVTGDRTINPNAPVLVMTTEVYKNSLLASDEASASEKYKDYKGVIYDEFHYLGDKERGGVWEEAVMYTPSHMQQLMLSATASNAGEIEGWLQDINGNIKTHLVNVREEERHVPLKEFVAVKDRDGKLKLEETKIQKIDIHKLENDINLSDRQKETLDELMDITGFSSREETIAYLKELAGRRNALGVKYLSERLQTDFNVKSDKADSISLILSNKNSTTYKKDLDADINPNPKMSRIVKMLDSREMTPALFYIFSKKGCNHELEKVAENSESLLTEEESRQVYDEVQNCIKKGVFLGSDFDDETLEALMKGFAVHHAGKLPAYKSLVETLARQGLVKVCFATETLLAGINMPFKTTVFTSLEKFDGEEITDISTSIFKQGSGRSGRRGKDDLGNVIIVAKDYDDYEKYIRLTSSKDTSIKSQYAPSYASVLSDRMLNSKDDALLKSLAAYQTGGKLSRVEELVDSRIEFLKSFGFIEENEDGTYQRTEKGEIAKRIYGINEAILTELLTNEDYLQGFTSVELIALAGAFSDVKDENPTRELTGDYKYLQNRMDEILKAVDEVDQFEKYYGIKDTKTQLSTNLVPYIIKFSQSASDRETALETWSSVMDEMREKELLAHEGDFLRVVNGTIDILKLIYELSPDENIKKEASSAIESLRKPPVMDIFTYELNLGV